jgi:hypothetical protein
MRIRVELIFIVESGGPRSTLKNYFEETARGRVTKVGTFEVLIKLTLVPIHKNACTKVLAQVKVMAY